MAEWCKAPVLKTGVGKTTASSNLASSAKTMKIELIPIKTRIIHPPKDDIFDVWDKLEVRENDIVFVSSKILGIHEGRCIKASEITKQELIEQEAERYLKYVSDSGKIKVNLTINQGILIPGAGIDESNAEGYFVLWPKNPDEICRKFRARLKKLTGVKNLAVVATDSHTMPLRLGVTGMAIGLSGLKPLKDIRGEEDIFGRKMHLTQIDKVDPLAAMAVAAMGESNERTPIVIMRGETGVEFGEGTIKQIKVAPEMDIYGALTAKMPKVNLRRKQ